MIVINYCIHYHIKHGTYIIIIICLKYVYKYTSDIGFYIINSIYMIGVKYNVLYLYSII